MSICDPINQLLRDLFRLLIMKAGLFILTFLIFYGTGFAQCQNFSLTLYGSDPVCHNDANGSITTNTFGANGSVVFTITDSIGNNVNSVPGGNPNLLISGWYYVEVIDDSACYLLDSIYLDNPPPISIQLSFVDPSSVSSCDGAVTVDTVINYQGNYNTIFYNWSPGGPSGLGEQVKNDLCNDFYQLTIFDEFGCSYFEEITSGSAGFQDNKHLYKVYPNPTSEVLIIETTNNEVIKVDLLDISGKWIFKFDNKSFLNLSIVEEGEYIIRITTVKGIFTEKIIKR